jgi:L-threonylcarbamoyladenylate synthase
MPQHPVALALIREAGTPLAAPSANRSEGISPTRAQHVADSLGDAVDMILDGGPCQVGIESTVLDMASHPPRILRPGMIGADQIEAVLGFAMTSGGHGSSGIARSPGQRPRHYAPQRPVEIVDSGAICAKTARIDDRRAYLVYSDSATAATAGAVRVALPDLPKRYAAGLYDALHRLDNMAGVDIIVVEDVPSNPAWDAIRDRLRRASASNSGSP